MTVREYITSYGFWLENLAADDNSLKVIRKSVAGAEQVNQTVDIPESAIPDPQTYSIVGAVGIDGDNNIVVGYAGYYTDTEGNGHYVVPDLGALGVDDWYLVVMDVKYRKWLATYDPNTGVSTVARWYGWRIYDSDGKKFVDVYANFACGGLCIAAALFAVGGAVGAGVTYYLTDKKAEEKKWEALAKQAEAEKTRWQAIEEMCRKDPAACRAWGGIVVANTGQTVTAASLAEDKEDGDTLEKIMNFIFKKILPLLAPLFATILLMIKLQLLVDVARSLFRRD